MIRALSFPHIFLFSINLLAATYVAALNLAKDQNGISSDIETTVVSASPLVVTQGASPVAIFRLGDEKLDDVNAQHPYEIVVNTPGAWVSRGDGQEHLTAIRSPVFTGAGACGAFVIAEDSIPVRAQGFCNINQLFDTHYETASAVEVFRGPSSTVFGGNGLFGGVNIISPSNSGPSTLNLELGSFDFKRLGFNFLDQSKTLQAYGSFTDTASFRDEAAYKQQKIGLKAYSGSGGWSSESSVKLTHLEQETAGYIIGLDSYHNDEAREDNIFPEAYRDLSSIRADSKWIKQDSDSITVVQPYLRLHEMEFLMHFVPWQPVEQNEHHSLGLKAYRGATLLGILEVVKGLDVDFSQGALTETQEYPAPFAQANFPQGTHYDYQVNSVSASPFIELNAELADGLKANMQTRAEWLSYDYHNAAEDGFACGASASACRFYRPPSRRDEFSFLSWRLGLTYAINEQARLYGNVAKANRAPQVAELYRLQSDSQLGLDTVDVEALEFGFAKQTEYFNLELNAYAMLQDNAIYQDTERRYLTGAKTSHQGFEYSFELRITDQLRFGSVGSYSVHKYENSPDQLGVSTQISGNEIDTAPNSNFAVTVTWESKTSRFRAVWDSLGEYYLDPENNHRYGGHSLVNLSWMQHLNKSTELFLQVKNALNESYAERADFAFGDYRYFPGAGRSAVIRLERSW